MSQTVHITTTPDTILRHAVELTDKRDGEDVWQRQARGLGELGYAVVTKDDAAELERLRTEVADQAGRQLAAYDRQGAELARLRAQLAEARAKCEEVARDGFDSMGLRAVETVLSR